MPIIIVKPISGSGVSHSLYCPQHVKTTDYAQAFDKNIKVLKKLKKNLFMVVFYPSYGA
jgi:hypothetical protein